MLLITEWKQVVKKAWSVRFMIASAIFAALEAIVPFFADTMPHNLFTGLSFISAAAAAVARVVDQENLK